MTMIEQIRRCWQSGQTLSQAYKRLNKRFDFTDKALLIAEWREMKRRFGCASLPYWYLVGRDRPFPEPPPKLDIHGKEIKPLDQDWYDRWKGNTGPGKLLRDIIKQEKKQTSVT